MAKYLIREKLRKILRCGKIRKNLKKSEEFRKTEEGQKKSKNSETFC
jgi:hypothetical protein